MFATGSLVKARGREWVVLPGSSDKAVIVRPLGGTEDEVTGIHLGLETVESAQFDLPNPSIIGDHESCRLLRDAVRLSSRSAAGPFRSLARIAVDPRPYQFVPLLMALKSSPVRICIADDVGISKTIEACLIARELLDRGEIQRIAVLCPPHLADQWQAELSEKFHIEAKLVLPGTARKLEKYCQMDQSVFDINRFVVVSLDFIKNDRRRADFVRSCPELVIVDEAHTCAFGFEGRGGRHQRHQLIKQLAEDPQRHMIFVTATPHCGKEETFRSLLSFLNKDFKDLPENLSGKNNEVHRRRLAQHFVQRRRKDIEHFLTETEFPQREEAEENYSLSAEYRKLFNRAIRYAQKTVKDTSGTKQTQRIKWWSVLALLRSLGSSPAAAAATLKERAKVADAETVEEADEIGRNSVFDVLVDEYTEGVDIIAGADSGDQKGGVGEGDSSRRELLSMAREAEKITKDQDAKLKQAILLVKKIVKDGYSPIIFCRYIPTAGYVAENMRPELEKHFKNIQVISITGLLPPEERKAKIDELSTDKPRVLVCTDCLSEGINLQDRFNAVMHYDLSWNPTRHEQREGRVDRFGQGSEKVRVLTYYSTDNQIDGIVLEVLIRKHKTIRNSLGVSVPVPVNTNAVTEAIFEGLLLREKARDNSQAVFDFIKPQREALNIEWDNAAEREKRSRTMFSQEAIQRAVADEVSSVIADMSRTMGLQKDVELFTVDAIKRYKGFVEKKKNQYKFDLSEFPRALRDALLEEKKVTATFNLPAKDGGLYLNRTHPFVERLASYIVDTALDSLTSGLAKRAGAIRTDSVSTRTTLLLIRLRYSLIAKRKDRKDSQLVEECILASFQGAPESPQWGDFETAEKLLEAKPKANIYPDQASNFIQKVIDNIHVVHSEINANAESRARELLEQHQKVRAAAKIKNITYEIEPRLPADVIGIYVFLPA